MVVWLISPVFGEYRPAFVIAPAAADLQIPRRQSLSPEAQCLHQRLRPMVAGLDVRLQAVKPDLLERVRNDLSDTVFHQPAPSIRRESVIPEICTSKAAVNDLVHVDDAGQTAWLLEPDEKCDPSRILMARQVIAVRVRSRRRLHPRVVERPAAPDRFEKLPLVGMTGQLDASAFAGHKARAVVINGGSCRTA